MPPVTGEEQVLLKTCKVVGFNMLQGCIGSIANAIAFIRDDLPAEGSGDLTGFVGAFIVYNEAFIHAVSWNDFADASENRRKCVSAILSPHHYIDFRFQNSPQTLLLRGFKLI